MTMLEPQPLLTDERGVPAGTTRDAADEALAWACLKDAVTALADAARERAIEAMAAQASEKQAVFDAAGDRLGTVSYTGGELRAEVTDKGKLLRWVKANHPTEIIEEVAPAFIIVLIQRALNEAAENGVESGEVLPGIRVGRMSPGLRITKTKLAREMGKRITERVLGGFEDRQLGK